nr:helix-turn-helix transcriptional regulator [Gordonia neofelifaecis]
MPTDRGSLEWDTYAFAFGHRLVTVRKARGLSQEELAERCGLHRNAVSNLERATSNSASGIADPLLSTVYRLARALEVPPTYLMPGADSRIGLRAAEQETNQALSEVEAELLAMLAADFGAHQES